MKRKGHKKATTAKKPRPRHKAAELRAESKRRKRELPAKVKLLRAELGAKVAKLRADYGALIRNARERTTLAAVRRSSMYGLRLK